MLETITSRLATMVTPNRAVANRLGRWMILAAIIAVGCAERFWMFGHVPFNSDEAIVMLQSQGILHGHFVSFYWGQFYGAGQAYVAAPLVAVFGAKAWVLRGSSVLLSALGAMLVWRIAKRGLSNHFLSLVIGALSFCVPLASVMQMTFAYGFRPVTYVCALACILLAVQVTTDAPVLWRWALLGLVAGVGWWSSPEVVWGLIPAALVIAMAWWPRPDWRAILKQAVVTTAAFCVGAVVWIWVTLSSSGATLKPQASSIGFVGRFTGFFKHTLPQEFGLRVYTTGSYSVSNRALTAALYLLLLVLLGASTYCAVRSRGLRRALGITVALSPCIYALNPATWFWLDGRYATFLGPLYLVVIAIGIEDLVDRWPENKFSQYRILVPWVVLICLLMSIGSFVAYRSTQTPSRAFAADEHAQSIAGALVADGVNAGWADYWLAYRLDALSNGQLHLSAVPGDLDRVLSDRLLTAQQRPATWLFVGAGTGVTPAQSAKGPVGLGFGAFVNQIHTFGIGWSAKRIAGIWVVTLTSPVDPSRIRF